MNSPSDYSGFIGDCRAALDDDRMELLLDRGVTREQADLFGIGYAGKIEHPDMLEWAKKYQVEDVFVFPVTNACGDVCGVQCRSTNKDKKGWQKFFWSKTDAMGFGLAQALPHIWETRTALLFEGNYDLFPIQRFRPNAFSVMTVHVSVKLMRLLERLCDRVVFCYDSDEAGVNAVETYKQRELKFRVDVLSPRLKSGKAKDFSELWEMYGDPGILSFLEKYLV